MLIAELRVWPSQRTLQGPKGSASLEPLVMAVFLALAARPGELVSRRELFNRLWGSLSVGDDNLNRLVAVLRRTIASLGVTSLRIETVPASGYVLRLDGNCAVESVDSDVEQALSQARESWRLGIPEPDHLRIALLARAGEMKPEDSRISGMLALLHRHAAEYAEPERTSHHVSACEEAANRALEIDSTQIEAATALVSIAPLYGRWLDGSRRLAELCAAAPGHPVPENDLSGARNGNGPGRKQPNGAVIGSSGPTRFQLSSATSLFINIGRLAITLEWTRLPILPCNCGLCTRRSGPCGFGRWPIRTGSKPPRPCLTGHGRTGFRSPC
jgi:DNA-binding winged helix-turn-helix (wHTH) protein